MPRVKPEDRVRHPLGWKHDPDPDGPRDVARFSYLCRLAELHPAVLAELRVLGVATGPNVDAWAARWRLTDLWCRAYVASTVRFWREHPAAGTYWVDLDDVAGALVPDDAPRIPAVLKAPEHFNWLIAFQWGASYYSLAPRSRVRAVDGGGVRVDAVTVRQACQRLAALLGLTLRPTKRGRLPFFP